MNFFSKATTIVAALVASALGVHAFSLLGPSSTEGNAAKDWQVFEIGYDLVGDIGGPMALSEGYRWNVPIINYAFDQSFIAYFGSNGMAAIDRAFAILNNLPPATQITDNGNSLFANGQRVPTDTKRLNFEAATFGLLDIKSHALAYVLEEMGLALPERFVFTLRGRREETIDNVTFTNYLTIKLNYDPITLQPSSFVNNTLYSYLIVDPIRTLRGNYASAIEFPVDPLDFTYTSVASGTENNDLDTPFGPFAFSGLFAGEFYTGLTHDDVGALRFLLSTNNLAVESLLPNIVGGQPAGGSSPWAPFLGTTNVFFGGSNVFFNTNIFGTNNLIITGLRPGVNKIDFRRVAYDSLLGQTFTTITNRYMDTTISNSRPVIQPVERIITQPDILFLASDLGLTAGFAPNLIRRTSTASWINNDAINGNALQGGPGVIPPRVEIYFTDILPFFVNSAPGFFLGEPFGGSILWGSFDGTTNAPIIYPAYGDITVSDLRNQALGRGGN